MGIVGLDLDILVTIEGLQCYDRMYYDEDNDLKLRTCGVKQSIVAVFLGGFLYFFMENHIYVLILWYVMVIQLSPQIFFLLLFKFVDFLFVKKESYMFLCDVNWKVC